jgi:hypothetical protein
MCKVKFWVLLRSAHVTLSPLTSLVVVAASLKKMIWEAKLIVDVWEGELSNSSQNYVILILGTKEQDKNYTILSPVRDMNACWMCKWIQFIFWYDMIYLLTAIGLSPGGSTHTTQIQPNNTKNNIRTTQIQTNVVECGPCPVFASFTLAFALQLRKKHGKPQLG